MRIYPKCLKGKQSYVSYDGHWLPCCWLPNFGEYYENSIFSKAEFDLTAHSIEEVVTKATRQRIIEHLRTGQPLKPITTKDLISHVGLYKEKRK